jgi:tRNA U34 5-methylaminomethyl-2-thiouridine-forming methyltransferase MnmC
MPDHDVQLITTSDGSHSLLNTTLNETYHSVHGAIQESAYVFIRNGLDYFIQLYRPQQISILEIGFGTGLNALMTLQSSCQSNISFHYTTIEAFPITSETAQLLNYPSQLTFNNASQYFARLHDGPWEQEQVIEKNFFFKKLKSKIQDVDFSPSSFDLIYFDAFAPSKQADMWEMHVLQKIEAAMKPGAVFVTYCAKGQLKRDLKSLGLNVETLSGPPGKKEMVRATKK